VVVVVGVPTVRSRLLGPALAPVEVSVSSPAAAPRVTEIEAPAKGPDEPSIAAPPVVTVSHASPARTTTSRVAPPVDPPAEVSIAPAPSPPPPAVQPGISAEVGLLIDARRKLDTDPAQAIALLARHSGDFPAGELAMERDVLMIEALDRTGERTEALRRAHEMLARSPQAFYASRLKELILRR
jgi:hypothetical protein